MAFKHTYSVYQGKNHISTNIPSKFDYKQDIDFNIGNSIKDTNQCIILPINSNYQGNLYNNRHLLNIKNHYCS